MLSHKFPYLRQHIIMGHQDGGTVMTLAFTIVGYLSLILQALPLKVMRPPMLSALDCPTSSTSPPPVVFYTRGLVLKGPEPGDNPY